MQKKFDPNYTITLKIMNFLTRIEAAKQKVVHLPVTPTVLASLRETARLYTTHYSTMIEGNVLSVDQIASVVKHKGHFPGRDRDEQEVKGYYAALTQVEQWGAAGTPVTEKMVQLLHALVMSADKKKVTPSVYRDGQNVIQDGRTRTIVYMPPEAKDVPILMAEMVAWIQDTKELPCPIVASIIHYQFATIHPYYDGNGRTARLLTTLLLRLGGYDLKGLYSLEEYYARNLSAYYQALTVGESHNYYLGRKEADITHWIEYFIEGMAVAFEKVVHQMQVASDHGMPDRTKYIRELDPKQRRVLELFAEFKMITSSQVGELFGYQPRTSAALCAKWVKAGFLEVADPSNKGRKYKLAPEYEKIIAPI